MKSYQLMPGIKTGAEGTSSMYVRGGSHDQNLFLFDDVPLYYIDHLGGFVSAFNTDAINRVNLIKGGFPARYGGRLSSVIDIRMKDGNNNKIQGSYNIGLLLTKATVEGPVKNDSTTFMISGRRFMYDLLSRPISKILFSGVSLGYHFYDINGKISHTLSDKDRIYGSFYLGDDRFIMRYKEKDDHVNTRYTIAWGNFLTAVRWNHIYNPRLFSNFTIYLTRYRYHNHSLFSDQGEDPIEQILEFNSRIFDKSLKADWDYYYHSNITFRFGYQFIHHHFQPGVTHYDSHNQETQTISEILKNQSYNSYENTMYLENIFFGYHDFNLNLGMRLNNYTIKDKHFFTINPRIIIEKDISPAFSVNTSFSLMHQYAHLLTSPAVGLPRDLWIPATDKAIPSSSYIFSAGLKKNLKNNLNITIDGYYKKMKDMIAYKEGIPFLVSSKNWEDQVETKGLGNACGLEIMLSKNTDSHNYFASYALSETIRKFSSINNGVSYNYKYDRPHELSLGYQYQIKQNISFSTTWVFYSGEAVTIPTGRFLLMDDSDEANAIELLNQGVIYPGKNTFRLKPYHRLDIGLRFKKEKRRGIRTWSINIYNAYNQQNPFYYYFEDEYDDDWNVTGTKLIQQSLFPILPSVSYRFEF